MAVGWLALLKHVPWTDVVSNAPRVAEGARKLWQAVAKKSPPTPAEAPSTLPPEARAVSDLASRLAPLETAVAELQSQMVASSELINALADQNAQLIARIAALQRRVAWLAAALAIVGIATGLAFVLLR